MVKLFMFIKTHNYIILSATPWNNNLILCQINARSKSVLRN